MFSFIKTTHLDNTTEVELEDGTRANQFHLDWLTFDQESQGHHVSAEGTFTRLEDFQNTLAKSREIILCDDPAVFEDSDYVLKTSAGGYQIRFSYDEGLEERIVESRARYEERRAAMLARVAAAREARA